MTRPSLSWQTPSPVSVRLVSLAAGATTLVRQVESVGDDAATRTVVIVVGLLVVVGVCLAGLAVWLWRATRPEPQLLAPLELMDERRWRRLDPQDRRRSLDSVRPDGAAPLSPSTRRPALDSEFAAARPVTDFADLAEPIVDPAADEDVAPVPVRSATSVPSSDGELSPGSVGTETPDTDDPSGSHGDGDEDEVADDPAEATETDESRSAIGSDDTADDTADDAVDTTVDADNPDDIVDTDEESVDDHGPIHTDLGDEGDDDPIVVSDRPNVVRSAPVRVDADVDVESERRPVVDDDDDTFEFDVPLMPGEGLLRRRAEDGRN